MDFKRVAVKDSPGANPCPGRDIFCFQHIYSQYVCLSNSKSLLLSVFMDIRWVGDGGQTTCGA